MTREDRSFALTVGGAFAVLAAVLLWRGHPGLAGGSGLAAVALGLLSLVAPAAIPPVRRTWMRGAHAMSRVTTPIVLGLVYFLVLTPTGLIRRAFGHSSLSRSQGGKTAWVARDSRRGAADMRRQF